MEFVCVSPMKLKIILDSDECDKYGIKPGAEECDGAVIRSALRTLFSLAQERCGFRVGCERVLVQIYPIPEGGGELFVTKLNSVGDREREAIKSSGSLTTYQGREAVFRFEDFDTLLLAAASIKRAVGESDLYRDTDGAYYIRTEENLLSGLSDVESLSEFGTRLQALPSGIDGEWGKLLVEGCALAYLRRLSPRT